MIEKLFDWLNKTMVKTVLAAVVFHIVYSFIFGMVIGGTNPLRFLYNNDYKVAYMVLMPLLASLPYIIAGYLIILGRNDYIGLKENNLRLFLISLVTIVWLYGITFSLQYFFPYRDMYQIYVFLNYPAASYLLSMDKIDYAQNYLVTLSVVLPPLMTYIGGKIRIKIISEVEIDGQNI